jgi:hypothetical protein
MLVGSRVDAAAAFRDVGDVHNRLPGLARSESLRPGDKTLPAPGRIHNGKRPAGGRRASLTSEQGLSFP